MFLLRVITVCSSSPELLKPKHSPYLDLPVQRRCSWQACGSSCLCQVCWPGPLAAAHSDAATASPNNPDPRSPPVWWSPVQSPRSRASEQNEPQFCNPYKLKPCCVQSLQVLWSFSLDAIKAFLRAPCPPLPISHLILLSDHVLGNFKGAEILIHVLDVRVVCVVLAPV